MITGYCVDQVRAAEQAAFRSTPEDVFMQRAAAGVAAAVLDELAAHAGHRYGARVVVLAGPGNNGGDGLFAGMRLARRGVRVGLVRTAEAVHERGWTAALAAGARAIPDDEVAGELDRADVVIDAILGLGGRPGLRGRPAELAASLRGPSRPRIVAVDLPSGLDADRPSVPDASLRADRTVTFGGHRLCHLMEPARSACGQVDVVDIGIALADPELVGWTVEDVAAAWPVPGPTSDKYARGVVGIDTGSDRYPGAGVLSTLGTVHAGAGMVRFVGPAHPAEIIAGRTPNVVLSSGRVQAWLVGSGWGDRPDGPARVAELAATGLPVVVDADAIGLLPPADRPRPQLLLTPHAGELARLLDRDRAAVEADPVTAVRDAVAATGATVLLKGATQYVATPDADGRPARPVRLAVPGPAWTAQAGSGDTLAGVCATLLAAGLPAADAAVAAASVQALIAARFPGPVPPQEAIVRLAETLRATRAIRSDTPGGGI